MFFADFVFLVPHEFSDCPYETERECEKYGYDYTYRFNRFVDAVNSIRVTCEHTVAKPFPEWVWRVTGGQDNK